MSQGINGFLHFAGNQLNHQLASLQSPPLNFREQRMGFTNMLQQQQQVVQPLISHNPIQFIHPLFDGNTMIQVAMAANQFPNTPNPQTPVKPQPTLFGTPEQLFKIESAIKLQNAGGQEMKDLYKMQKVAAHGCQAAAQLYAAHSKRPYFKKIDLLCDRLSQDLRVTDKAVVNINSHGVAWAIKDFIFVFTRIASAWVIMRDYFYTQSDGMRPVKQSLDPNLMKDFMEWQGATEKFTKSLIKSFENLHNRDQRNGNRKGSNGMNSNEVSPATSATKTKTDKFQSLFDPLIAEDSEKAQLEGGYLKSALYQPVSSSSEDSSPPQTPRTASNDCDPFAMFNDLLSDDIYLKSNGGGPPTPLYKRCAELTPEQDSAVKNQYKSKTSLMNRFDSERDGIPLRSTNNHDWSMLFNYEALQKIYGHDGAVKIQELFNEIMGMPGVMNFMSPNFNELESILSLDQIISNVQQGNYLSISDIYIALKMMIEHAKSSLPFCPQGEQADSVCAFINGLELAFARYK